LGAIDPLDAKCDIAMMEPAAFAQLVNRLVEFCPAVHHLHIAGRMLANAFTTANRVETEFR